MDEALRFARAMKWMKKGIVRLISVCLMIFVMFPFIWLLLSSFKHPVELLSVPPSVWPKEFTLEYYADLLRNEKVVLALRNSFIVSAATTLISLAIGIFASYVFARLQFRGRKSLYLLIMGTQMLPAMAILIPMFMLMRVAGLLYTYQGLIVANVAFSLPYVIWMYAAFVRGLPYEVEEAARIDGCSRLQILFRIVVPLSRSGLAASAIFVFIGVWNEFLFAVVMTQSGTRTLPVQIAEFIGEDRIRYEMLFPASILSCLPVLIVVMIFQKYIIQGLTEGAVK